MVVPHFCPLLQHHKTCQCSSVCSKSIHTKSPLLLRFPVAALQCNWAGSLPFKSRPSWYSSSNTSPHVSGSLGGEGGRERGSGITRGITRTLEMLVLAGKMDQYGPICFVGFRISWTKSLMFDTETFPADHREKSDREQIFQACLEQKAAPQ